MDVVIYGAQAMAFGVYKALRNMLPDKRIECFLVTKLDGNAPSLDNIPVKELREFSQGKSRLEKDKLLILIATPENVMDEIADSLEREGFQNYVRIDSGRWADMMGYFYVRQEGIMPLSVYPVGCHKTNLLVYKMVHYKDKPLKTKVEDPEYMRRLQVGACSSENCDAEYMDHTGNNISEKNSNYSELTGLYWMWKNQIQAATDYDYYGLAHYRRRLQLTNDDLLRLRDNDIDVILPYPMPYTPNIEEHHKRYLSEEEWGAVCTALCELQPSYAEKLNKILKQEYFYNYNVILAKTKVLDAYCNWLFPILFRIEEMIDPKGEKKPNRYMGYVGEMLETLYFMCNKQKLRIAHTGCKFIT